MGLNIPAGVLTGDQVQQVFKHAKDNNYALPAINVIGTNSINSVMEAAVAVNSPVIIQFSNGGAVFFAGKRVLSFPISSSPMRSTARRPRSRAPFWKPCRKDR